MLATAMLAVVLIVGAAFWLGRSTFPLGDPLSAYVAQPVRAVVAPSDADRQDEASAPTTGIVIGRGTSLAHPDEGSQCDSLSCADYDAGAAEITLAAGESLVGQSYQVNGQGSGCQVFGAVGPATIEVVDGEWWVVPHSLSEDELADLMAEAEASGDADPAARCEDGWTWTVFD
jgi:hypothetical protein